MAQFLAKSYITADSASKMPNAKVYFMRIPWLIFVCLRFCGPTPLLPEADVDKALAS